MDDQLDLTVPEQTLEGLPGMFFRAQDLLSAGGPVVAILLGLSIIALAIVLIKLVQFTHVRIGERRFVESALEIYRQGDVGQACGILASERNPIARVMEIAMRGRQRADVSEVIVREEITRVAGDEIQNLRSYLNVLEVIATLSPLLGLLGTVLGMIEAFQQLEQAGNQVNPSILSGGIWEALLTTAVGLAVAIPVVALLNWLEGQVERLAHDMEGAVTRIFTLALNTSQVTNVGSNRQHATEFQPEG